MRSRKDGHLNGFSGGRQLISSYSSTPPQELQLMGILLESPSLVTVAGIEKNNHHYFHHSITLTTKEDKEEEEAVPLCKVMAGRKN